MAIKFNDITLIDNDRFVTNARRFSVGVTTTDPNLVNSNFSSDAASKLLIDSGNVYFSTSGNQSGAYTIGPYVANTFFSNTSSTTTGDAYPGYNIYNFNNVSYSVGEILYFKTGLDVNLNRTICSSDTNHIGYLQGRAWSDSNGGRFENACSIQFVLNSRNITGSGNHPSGDIIFYGRSSSQTGQYDTYEVARIEGDNGNFRFMSGYGSAGIAYGIRAWVNFAGAAIDGTSPETTVGSGTYTYSLGIWLIDITNHGLTAGRRIRIDFTSGTGVDGYFTVGTITNANRFTVTATSVSSGNCTVYLLAQTFIRNDGNVSSITYNGTGNYTINFTNALTDANYASVGGGRRIADVGAAEVAPHIGFSNYATTSVKIGAQDNDNNNFIDSTIVTAAIVR